MACQIPRLPPINTAVCPSSENTDGSADVSAEVVMLFKHSLRYCWKFIRRRERSTRWSKAEEIRDGLPWDVNILVASRPTFTFVMVS